MHTQPAPLSRPTSVRLRGLRRPFVPSTAPGPYRLPTAVLERLTTALEPFRNRDSAFALAVLLARFWSAPGRLVLAFPIDRRALADRADLGLSEARVRGAIATLELVGFLDRAVAPAGSRYKPTADGLHRKPVLWQFGGEFVSAFQVANARSKAARGGHPGDRRPMTFSEASQPSTGLLEAPAKSPKAIALASLPKGEFLMGEQERGLAKSHRTAGPTEPNSALEAALARLAAGLFATGSNSGEPK